MTAPAGPWIEVAAAVIERPDGEFLLAQRPEGKVYAGWWEFPGGKIEAGEDGRSALARELHEELGIELTEAWPWITRTHVYEHGRVRLHFFRVTGWHGEPVGRERQRFEWQRLPALTVGPVLPANGPILKALGLPLVMGVTQASRVGPAAFLRQLDAALGRGLRLVQLREHDMDRDTLQAFGTDVVTRAHRQGATVVLNGPVSLAASIGADGVHLPAGILRETGRRPAVEWVGASCHRAAEIERACDLDLDYVVIGPVAATPTHPGRPGIGWDGFRQLADGLPMPAYAIGGMALADLGQARVSGAHGVAAIRSAWAETATYSASGGVSDSSPASTGIR